MKALIQNVELTAFTRDSFNKEGVDIKYQYALLRYDGSLYRIAVAKDLDLTPWLDSKVDLVVSFSPSADRASRVVIVECGSPDSLEL